MERWRVERAEASAAAALESLLATARPGAWRGPALRAELERDDATVWWIRDTAEADRAAGVLLARRVLDEIHVLDVAVAPGRRRQGMARALLRAALAACVAGGVRRALLEVRADNAAALGLYRGQGFVVVGRRPRYYPDGEDALLMTRTVDPDPPGLPIRAEAEVIENRAEGGASHRLRVRVPGWPGAEPGQFVMVSAGALTGAERSDPLLPRPMAVYRGHAAGSAQVEILYKVHGRGTQLLAEALPGQRLRWVGPLGMPFPAPPGGARALLVGGGTGIASLYELAARASHLGEVQVLLGARSEGDLMGLADFEALDAALHVTTEDGSRGRKGLVTEALDELLAAGDGRPVVVYACGPTPMMQACGQLAARSGARCLVSLENNMACGFGVCLGCAVPVRSGGFSLICRAGPVYEADEVAWEGLP